jgi:hypothetical protein
MTESAGVLIGLSNVLTSARARAAAGPPLDGHAAIRDRVRSRALRALEGRECRIEDVIVHGRRLRLLTNSHHLADFWRENFASETQWRETQGPPPPRQPAVTVHAAVGLEGEPEASYADAGRSEAYLVNSSWYGDLRACAMEALARVLAPEGRVLHGAAAEVAGRGLLVIYPKEVILPTPTWGLLELPGSKFLADGWLFLAKDGRVLALERGVYFRACTVAHYPDLVPRLLGARFENVPDPDPAELERRGPEAQALLDRLREADPSGRLRSMPSERGRELIVRLTTGTDARALASAASLFGASRVIGALRPDAAFALQAGKGGPLAEPAAFEGLPCPAFAVRPEVHTGHPREVARVIART